MMRPKESDGLILILPHFTEVAALTVDVLTKVLPDIQPALFPHFEGHRWVERPEYELLPVLDRKAEQTRIKQETKSRLSDLDEQIAELRSEASYLHGILTKTDNPLVLDVKRCLEELGFDHVVDADAEVGKESQLEEDLRIEDGSPMILVEVKGIAALPREDDAIQVVKYVGRRMKALGRKDVRGLFIVNHQRHLPPLDRDNTNVFTEKQIDDARNYNYTLVTTWNLFRLLRGFKRWDWTPEHVRPLLQVDGRMPSVPTHYHTLGTVVRSWPEANAVSIQVEKGSLSVGDHIGFVTATAFLEQEVTSLELDSKSVSKAEEGQCVGIGTDYTKEDCPKGTRVHIITGS